MKNQEITLMAYNVLDVKYFHALAYDEKIARISVHREKYCLYLWSFYVHEEYQNRGIGSAILCAVLHQAVLCKERYIRLGVFRKNIDAQRLYKRFNFVIINDEINYGGPYEMQATVDFRRNYMKNVTEFNNQINWEWDY